MSLEPQGVFPHDVQILEHFKQDVEGKEQQNARLTSLFDQIAKVRVEKATLLKNVATYIGQINQLQTELMERERQKNSLKTKVNHLNACVDQLEARYDLLMVCQAGCSFELAICSYVLPIVYANRDFASLHVLLNYVNGGKKLPGFPLPIQRELELREAAKEKWRRVCENLGLPGNWVTKTGNDWDVDDHNEVDTIPEIIKAIEWLKHNRIKVAHPLPVDVEKVSGKILSMNNSFPPYQVGVITRFITSLNDTIVRSGLYHRHLTVRS